MSSSASIFSPALVSVLDSVRQLSRREKTLLADRIEAELSSEEVPEWHLGILEERSALRANGQDPALPAAEAFRQIRERRPSR